MLRLLLVLRWAGSVSLAGRLRPVPFEVDQGADAGNDGQGNQPVHRRPVVTRHEAVHSRAIDIGQIGHGEETPRPPRRQRGKKLFTGILPTPAAVRTEENGSGGGRIEPPNTVTKPEVARPCGPQLPS